VLVVDREVVDDADLQSESFSDAVKELRGGEKPLGTCSRPAHTVVIGIAQKAVKLAFRVR
jgi:hypothetical protein